MAKTTWKQVVYDVADAIRTTLDNEDLIAVGDLAPIIQTLKDTSDATAIPFDIGKSEVAYGPEGKIIGESPFKFVVNNEEKLEYKLLNDELSTELKLSADNCETVELFVVDNEIVLDSMFVSEDKEV